MPGRAPALRPAARRWRTFESEPNSQQRPGFSLLPAPGCYQAAFWAAAAPIQAGRGPAGSQQCPPLLTIFWLPAPPAAADPNAPKRPLSAYMFFAADKRKEVRRRALLSLQGQVEGPATGLPLLSVGGSRAFKRPPCLAVVLLPRVSMRLSILTPALSLGSVPPCAPSPPPAAQGVAA